MGFHSERGIALVITVFIVTILVTLVVELTYSTQTNVRIAATYRDDLQAYYVARSGVELAMAVLKMDSEDDQEKIERGERAARQDSLDELWANLPEAVAAAQLLDPELFGNGRLVVRVVDEDRKINANLANQDPTASILERLFAEGGISDQFRNALIDWIDDDQEETNPGGAEAGYYESLDVPYPCKDGPMDTISEVRMIRGGEEATKTTLTAFRGEKPEEEGKWSLQELLSALPGRGATINVNTAPGPVLLALHEDIDNTQVEETLMDRATDPFPTVQAFRDYYANNFGIAHLPANLAVESEYFTIESTGIVGEVEKRLKVTVHRTPGSGMIDIISWRVE